MEMTLLGWEIKAFRRAEFRLAHSVAAEPQLQYPTHPMAESPVADP
jgi:hypothetical protein